MTSKTAKYVPPQSQEDLVLAWLRRARESQMAHYEMANTLSNKGRFLGVPVIVLTTIIGTSAFASVAADVIPSWSKILVGFLSVAAAVMSSLQTFFNYSDRAEKHRASAARFGAVRRKLEAIYANRGDGLDQRIIDALREELGVLAQESLHVPAHIFKKIQENVLYIGDADANKAHQPIGHTSGG